MRVLIDSNVFISYLLTPHHAGSIQTIMAALSANAFTLLLPEALLEEIVVTVKRKPHLAKRIPPRKLQAFVNILQGFGETIPRIKDPIPAVVRDPKDDYLLAYAMVGQADYLVSGDKDLLLLQGAIEGMDFLDPPQFAALLAVGK